MTSSRLRIASTAVAIAAMLAIGSSRAEAASEPKKPSSDKAAAAQKPSAKKSVPAAASKSTPRANAAAKAKPETGKAKASARSKAADKTNAASKKPEKAPPPPGANSAALTGPVPLPAPRQRSGASGPAQFQMQSAAVPAAAGPTGAASAPGGFILSVPSLAPPAQAATQPSTRMAYAPSNDPAVSSPPLASAPTASTSGDDVTLAKQAIALVRRGRITEATQLNQTIGDPLARKLVEWVILRSDDNSANFARYNAFIAENPGWPSIVTLRRRAESMLWFERGDPAKVRAFFAAEPPRSAKGKFLLARALLSQGDHAGAQRLVRETWRSEAFGSDLEDQVRDTFAGMITAADDKARMDTRLYADDTGTALRMAKRLGGTELALAKARIAVSDNAGNAKALLDAVPEHARKDPLYIFSRSQWLRRADKIEEAARLLLTAPADAARQRDLEEWWTERRVLARKLLDAGDARTAYRVVSAAIPPTKENARAECHFTAGWIALRFLNDPAAAAAHFARINEPDSHPTTLARGHYWQGRAAEAAHRAQEARRHYQAAARYSSSYYGQIARAKLNLPDLDLTPLPALSDEQKAAFRQLEVVRAADILYRVGERDLAAIMLADLGDKTRHVGAIAMLGDVALRHEDARALLLLGKGALGRGLGFDHYAFPTNGIPRYDPIAPPVETALVYSIARQESGFNPRVVSSAKALGLMQVIPSTGKHLAKRYGVKYDQKRLLEDKVYNVQMGAAELATVLERHNGSYILAFAAYNAGSGRVREWIARYGDPREGGVDPIDWVERIPFSETRNYVQRIMENVQVYRVRFNGDRRLRIEADLQRGALRQ